MYSVIDSDRIFSKPPCGEEKTESAELSTGSNSPRSLDTTGFMAHVIELLSKAYEEQMDKEFKRYMLKHGYKVHIEQPFRVTASDKEGKELPQKELEAYALMFRSQCQSMYSWSEQVLEELRIKE